MDAVEFIKTKKRLCSSVACMDCPVFERIGKTNLTCTEWTGTHPEEAVSIIEQWAHEHPIKTRQSEFLKQWPNAACKNDVLNITPCNIDQTIYNVQKCNGENCFECRKKFWGQGVEP